MSDEATCRHCGGRIVWLDGAWAHDYISLPVADRRAGEHAAWPKLHAQQVWRTPRRQTDRPRVDPWETPEWKAAHPGSRTERTLAWLTETFSRAR